MVHDWRYFSKAFWAHAMPNLLEQMPGSYFSEPLAAKSHRFNQRSSWYAGHLSQSQLPTSRGRLASEFIQDHSERFIWKTIHPLESRCIKIEVFCKRRSTAKIEVVLVDNCVRDISGASNTHDISGKSGYNADISDRKARCRGSCFRP